MADAPTVGTMLTLVDIRRSPTSARETAALVADYLEFDRRRIARRQYTRSFGGMAILVLLGAVFGRVPIDEGLVVAGLLLLIPLAIAVAEAWRWSHLMRRLDRARTQCHDLKVVKKS